MRLRLESGDDAEAQAIDGNVLTLRSARAFAPGSPIRFTVEIDGDQRSIEGRALGSKRIGDFFEVRMRFVNLRRSHREWLEARVGRDR